MVTSPASAAPLICGADSTRSSSDSCDSRAGQLSGEDTDAHGAAFAQVSGQRAGVDAADTHDALLDQLVLEGAPGAPAGGPNGRVAHDVAGDPDAAGLVVLVVDAGVADVRCGHDDDLAVVARVGQRLLVAAHAGGEHGLTNGLADRSVGVTTECAAVLQDEDRGLAAGEMSGLLSHTSAPFRTVGRPRRSVA